MHSLMSTILLRPTWPNALRPDAQLNPPYRQPGQTSDAQARKGPTIVAADDFWQTIFPKGRFKTSPHRLQLRPLKRLDPQQIAAPSIAQGPRFAPLPVTQYKPPFKIGAPHLISPLV